MGTNHNVIHLNGKLYDAKTGKQVTGVPSSANDSTSHALSKNKKNRSVDGFFINKKVAIKQTKKIEKKTAPDTQRAKARAIKHTIHHKQQKSKTLMRSAVALPTLSKDQGAKSHAVNKNGHDNKRPINARYKRAMEVPKSSLISRFSASPSRKAIEKRTEPLAVMEPPIDLDIKKEDTGYNTSGISHKSSSIRPKSQAEIHFNRALSKSHAHENKPRASKKPKTLSRRLGISQRALRAVSGTLAFVLLFGFFAYQNVPNISMKIAASRAGFSAKLPDYKPSGFALAGPIEYEPGRISIAFSSNSDDRTFQVSEQVSGWNSEALADNYLIANDKTYQTYQDKGRTIYLYDNSSATWVSGGVWYEVNGNGVLNNDQLVRVANSL